jgi:hypothetical protein
MYNIPFGLRSRGNLDTRALRASLDDLVKRHESFRTTFLLDNGTPSQRVVESVLTPLEETDLRDLPGDQLEPAMQQLADKEARWVFELTDRPPIRFHLLRLGSCDHVLLVNMHHIISDGWSLNIFKREFPELYMNHLDDRAATLPALPIQYVDYAVWQREWLCGARLDQALQYWRKQLNDLPLLEMPTDHPRLSTPCTRAAKCFFTIPAGVTSRLQAVVREQQATLFMAMFAMFAWTLRQLTGQHDVTIGGPMANRSRRGLSGIVGLFTNTVPLRINLTGVSGLQEAIHRAKETVLGAYERQEIPYQLLVDELGPTRPAGRLPFFEVTILETRIVPWPALVGCNVEAFSLAPAIPKYDLALEYWEAAGELQGKVSYAAERFDNSTIEHLVSCFVGLLSAAAERGARLDDVPTV